MEKINFDDYINEELNGFGDNYEKMLIEISEKINSEKNNINESEKNIEKVANTFGTQNNMFIKKAEEAMRPFQQSIKESEDKIKNLE